MSTKPKRKFFPVGKIILCLVVLVLAFFFLRDLIWRVELVRALDSAAEVKVVEHSNVQDQGVVGNQPRIYHTVALNAEQIAKLRSLFWKINDETPPVGILKCLFVEHHYIEMVAKDGRTRTVLLCFECGQFYLGDKPDDNWDYTKLGKMSDSWKTSASEFISSLGLHPDGPWRGPDAVGK